ncbi:MAG TPA: hypothetical protein VI389_01830 [Geobacteraceae bacterium]
MKRILRLFGLGTLLATLSGCFQVSTVVRVNQDGSGTIEERMLVSKKLVAQLNEFMHAFAEEGTEPPKPMELFEPEKLRQAAKGMGEEVSFTGAKKLDTDEFEGYAAEYAFADINRLRLNQKSSPPLPSAKTEDKSPALMFSFTKGTKGNPATLVVRQQDAQAASPAPNTAPPATASSPEQAAKPGATPADPQIKALEDMFNGLRISMAVEVNGTITKTNATYHDASRVTVIDLDWERLSGASDKLAGLGASGGDISVAEARKILKDIPGIKVDLNDELRVEFTGK